MAETLAPGVYTNEIDLTLRVPKVSTSITAFAGKFNKGVVDKYMLVTSEDELVELFGDLTNDNYNDWMQCSMFLKSSNKLYISRAVDKNGSWQGSNTRVRNDILQPATGDPGIDSFEVIYAVSDIIAGSYIRFVLDSNQVRYKIIEFNETHPAAKQKDTVDFGSVTFPLTGGEVFDIKIDSTDIVYTGVAGDDVDTVIDALTHEFDNSGIQNVTFTPDHTNDEIVVEAVLPGVENSYSISVGAGDTAGTGITNTTAADDGIATVTLDNTIDWDGLPGTEGSKKIIHGPNSLDYIYTLAINAFNEVKVDSSDYSRQVTEIVFDNGTYNIGDQIQFTINELYADGDSTNDSTTVVTYVIQDEDPDNPTGTVEDKTSLIKNVYNAIVTSNLKTIDVDKDVILGKIILTDKYPGTAYSFTVSHLLSLASGSLTVTENTTNATDGTPPVDSKALFATRLPIFNDDDFETKKSSIKFSDSASKLKVIARWVGDTGNKIDVTIAKKDDFNVETPKDKKLDVSANGIRTVSKTIYSPILAIPGIPLDSLFEYIPNDDEVAIVVSYNGEIKEKFIVSFDETAKDYNGKSKYIENVINKKSSYIYVIDNKAQTGLPESTVQKTATTVVEQYQINTGRKIGKSVTTVTTGEVLSLMFGDDGNVGLDDILEAYEVFRSVEEIDVDILIANEMCSKDVVELAESRGDCIAIAGPNYNDIVGLRSSVIVSNMIEYVNSNLGDLNMNSSYGAFFGNYLNVYDKYNDTYRWINPAGAVAGLRAKVNSNFFTWYASAGIDNGQIPGVEKLAFIPNRGQMGILYKNKVNAITAFPGEGNAIVYGQKTLLSQNSAFNRINVRGLFNTLKRSVSRMSRALVFQINDEITRKRFVQMVTPYLEEIKYNRGIYDFYVQCDEKNNTPEVIDNEQFVGTIAVQPSRIAEFIILNFVAVPTGVDFKEYLV